jgi:hypothetical protein
MTWHDLFFHHKKTAKLLSHLIQTKQYNYQEIKKHSRMANKKMRNISQFHCFDIIINKTIFNYLFLHYDHVFIDNLFSYRNNRDIFDAQNVITNFIKNAQYKKLNKSKVDLYVYRTDIKDYTDSIPIHTHSPLWKKLKPLIKTSEKDQPWINELLNQSIRPIIQNKKNSSPYCSIRGTPMGSPITVFLANLYLNDLDHELNKIPQALYARFGDDIIFIHSDKNIVLAAQNKIYQTLKVLGLRVNKAKEKRYYLTHAGKPCDSRFQGTSTINYIGFGFHANGKTSLKKGKTKKLTQTVRTRIQRIRQALSGLKAIQKAKVLSQHINKVMETDSYESLYYQQQIQKITEPNRLKQLYLLLADEITKVCVSDKNKDLYNHIKYHISLPLLTQEAI